VCVAPSLLRPAYLIQALPNAITIGWHGPEDDGGCPITGYAVFRDNSNDSTVDIEINSVNDASIRDSPVLRKVTANNFSPSTEGLWFRFKVRVFNREGFFDSNLIRVLNAGPPLSPTFAPVLLTQS
jgi:hypothetical protein